MQMQLTKINVPWEEGKVCLADTNREWRDLKMEWYIGFEMWWKLKTNSKAFSILSVHIHCNWWKRKRYLSRCQIQWSTIWSVQPDNELAPFLTTQSFTEKYQTTVEKKDAELNRKSWPVVWRSSGMWCDNLRKVLATKEKLEFTLKFMLEYKV